MQLAKNISQDNYYTTLGSNAYVLTWIGGDIIQFFFMPNALFMIWTRDLEFLKDRIVPVHISIYKRKKIFETVF